MSVSVIVPTFNEGANAEALLSRLDVSLRGLEAEVIFVDDGSDDLPTVVDQLRSTVGVSVRVIRRSVPTGRLGGAVVEGIKQSTGDILIVVDGDLQHPPELIPQMMLASQNADMVVASRYIEGGSSGGLSNGLRKIVSRSTGMVTKVSFPRRLKTCTDPMSGFFLVKRSYVDVDTLRPRGFKILLEIIARSRPMKIVEVPLVFAERVAGESHATVSEGMRFLRQLFLLRLNSKVSRFLVVGASGVVPNLVAVLALTNMGMHFLVASILAVQVAIVWNFIGAEFLVWRDYRSGHWVSRGVKFLAVAETDLLRIPFVVLLVALFHGHAVVATALTLMGAFVFRFSLADKLVYKKKRPGLSETAVSVEEAA